MIETHPGDERAMVRFGDLRPGDAFHFEIGSVAAGVGIKTSEVVDSDGDVCNFVSDGEHGRLLPDTDVTPMDITFTPRTA